MRQASPRIFRALLLGAIVFSITAGEALAYSFRYSQIGYHPQGHKYAILEGVPAGQQLKLELYDPDKTDRMGWGLYTGRTVYKITDVKVLEPSLQQPGPATQNLLIDFSDFTVPGEYEIRVEGADIKSPTVKISEFLYWDALKPAANIFYYQRCGHPVENVALGFYHLACHTDDAEYVGGGTLGLGDSDFKDVAGGWHFGHDYNKYVTPTSLAAARLMGLYEWSPRAMDGLNLQYSVLEPAFGRVPPLLYEASFGLDWLMAMQRRDGALFRKVAGKEQSGTVRPEEDEQPRFLYGVSSQDTAAAAAALAMAARNFHDKDMGYAVKTLLSAERAWAWLSAHPQPTIDTSASDLTGSEEFIEVAKVTTDPAADLPYRLWAAVELYLSTGKPVYHQYFLANYNKLPVQLLSWRNPAILGFQDYLLYAKEPDSKAVAWITRQLTTLGNGVAARIQKDPYHAGLGEYREGSNGEVLEQAALLLTLNRLNPNEKYLQAATDAVGYLYGVNPYGISYVTGTGSYAVQKPAHTMMRAVDNTLPGYLVGGPNAAATDGKTPAGKGLWSYADNPEAVGSNRSNILYNASLVYVLGALNAAYNITQR